jgi:hypothetical protein
MVTPPDWKVLRKPLNDPNGEPQSRPKGMKPPCDQCPKVPLPLAEGQVACPELAVELSERNAGCYRHYRECRAVNWNVPEANDPLVRKHAAVIRGVEDAVERAERLAAAAVGGAVRAAAKPTGDGRERRRAHG